jgi:hypothetical protein
VGQITPGAQPPPGAGAGASVLENPTGLQAANSAIPMVDKITFSRVFIFSLLKQIHPDCLTFPNPRFEPVGLARAKSLI